jgi:hypothetical protein
MKPGSAAVAERLAAVRERIVHAGGTDDVVVLAVTKGFGVEVMVDAVLAGCRHVGENYAQELVAKLDAWPAAVPRPCIHMIGTVQTNKVKALAGRVDVWETVDRPSLAEAVARRQPGARVLVQVNTTSEEHKGGCPVASVAGLAERCRDLGLDVSGLMTVGPTEGGPEAARPGFRTVRSLVDDLGLTVCSMGMTADLEVAVQEGSTEVRVGTALFGDRPRLVRAREIA